MEGFTRHQVLSMTWSKFWSEAYCRVHANLQDFIFRASSIGENLIVEMTFVMVFSDACNIISDKVVDQASYSSVLVICMKRTFLHLLPWSKYIVRVEVELQLTLMFIHTPTSSLKRN